MSDHHDDDDDYVDEHPSIIMPDSQLVRVRKGEEINITRLDPGIREVTLGVGWDLKRFEGDPIDMDASVFLLDKNDKTRQDEDFIFYNNLTAREGAVKHLGDSRTGAGDGDDEKIVIDLMALPFEIIKIAFVLSIYDLDLNSNNFTMVKNVYFRILNNETNLESFRFELDEEMGNGTGLYIGYIERVGSDWMFKALGEPIYGGLTKAATDYGIVVTQNMRS
ncbi:MAG TPA: TerD family protein [Micavibrio sp.]|nr:TerD family protein [Micavibrio sp.]